MALFSFEDNALLIKLAGHWCSDAMLCYLFVQSCPNMSGLSKHMLAGGYSQLLVEPPLCPYPTHPNLQAKGVPGPQPLSWIGLVKPNCPHTRKEIPHNIKSCVVIVVHCKKKNLHLEPYESIYSLPERKHLRLHFAQGKFSHHCKEIHHAYVDLCTNKKREFCIQEREALLLYISFKLPSH